MEPRESRKRPSGKDHRENWKGALPRPATGRPRPKEGDRKHSLRPGISADLVHVSGNMAAHRSGPLKQQNKAHKGGRHRGRGSAQRDGKGEKIGLEEEELFSRF